MLILALWIQSFPGYTQSDSLYCLPISKARLLVQDAVRLQLLQGALSTLEARVELLESEKTASYKSFSNLLKLSEQKYSKQKENTLYMEKLAMSYKGQMEYYQKRERKQRRKKNIVTYGAVVLISLLIIK